MKVTFSGTMLIVVMLLVLAGVVPHAGAQSDVTPDSALPAVSAPPAPSVPQELPASPALPPVPPLEDDEGLLDDQVARQLPIGEGVFRRIELTSDGVVAHDTAGARWIYDFAREVFLPDEGGRVGDRLRGDEGRGEEQVQPVEERCIRELKVSRPSLDAIFVSYDEYVDDDIQAYGRVTVKGWVKGSITSVNERVLVTASGRVDGDIRAPEIVVKDGAVVYGEQVITSPLDISHFVTDSFVTDGIWVVFGFTLCFLLIAFLVVSLAPRQLGRVTTCIENNRARSFFVGLLLLILTPVIIGLLTFTIIGIPIVAVLPLAYLVALGMGMMTCGRTFLRLRATDPGGRSLSNMASALLGVAAYMGLWAGVAILLGSASSVAEGFGITLLVISILATVWPFLTGLGAVVLTRFGFREYISFQERTAAGVVPAPAPPPMPRTPPISPAVPPPPRDGSGPEPPPLSTPDR